MRDRIKFLLKEALGVPQDILKTSTEIYETFYEALSEIPYSDSTGQYSVELEDNFKISDYTFNEVKISVNCHEQQNFEEIVLLGGQVSRKIFVHPLKPITREINEGVFNLNIDFAVPEDFEFGDLINFLDENKPTMLRLFSHELKHLYDSTKKDTAPFSQRSEYMTYSETRFGIPPIDEFLHYCYFITQVENLVRPTELASLMSSGEVTRGNFIDFLKNNDLYKMLLEIRSFDVKTFKEKLKSYEKKIDEVFKHVNETPPIDLDEKIDRFIDIFFVTLTNARVENLKSMVFHNPLSRLINNYENEAYLDRFLRRVTKYKNGTDFLESEEKRFKFVSQKMIKKISKLFDMAKTNESIVDWDLYHKVKKTKITEFTNKLKYKKK